MKNMTNIIANFSMIDEAKDIDGDNFEYIETYFDKSI